MSRGPRLAPSTLGLIAVGVVAVSMSGPVMASLAVPALVISFWRNGLATLVLAPAALLRRRAEIAGLSRAELGWVVASGVCLAVHFGTWVTSLTMTSVAASTAIVCLQIAWVAGWDRLTGVRLPTRAVAGLVAAFVGVLVITGVDVAVSTRALAGDLLALAGSVAVAAYTVIGGRARRTVSTTSYTFVCYGTAAVLLLVASVVSGASLVGYGAREWALIGLVTLTSQLLGHSVFNYLLDRIRPVVVSLAILLEIPGAALLAAAFLGQVPPVGVFAGLALILGGMGRSCSRARTGPTSRRSQTCRIALGLDRLDHRTPKEQLVQTQVVILAAGLGTRLGRPHPKPLTPLTNGETIMRRAVHLLRDAWADVHVTAVVGFKLDLVIEAMPDISFVYNEVYDSTNTCKSLLKALTLSHEGGVLWMNGDVVFDPRVLGIVDERIRNGQSFVCVDHASVAEEEVKYTLGDDDMIKELSKTVVGGLGEAVGINYVSAEDKAALIVRLDECDDQDYFERGIELAIEKDGLSFEPVDISDYQVVEVDFDDDLTRANAFVSPPTAE